MKKGTKVLKVLTTILVVVLAINIGYFIVNTVCNLFEGYTFGGAVEDSWDNIVHMFGIIPKKPLWDFEFPFTNLHVTFGYAKVPH